MIDAIAAAARVAEVHGVTPERFTDEIVPAYRPVVLRGLVAHWSAVAAGRAGPAAMADYIRRFDGGRPIHLTNGDYHYRGWRDVPKDWPTTPPDVCRLLVEHGASVDLV